MHQAIVTAVVRNNMAPSGGSDGLAADLVQPELNHGTAPPFEGGEEVRNVGVKEFLTAARAIINGVNPGAI